MTTLTNEPAAGVLAQLLADAARSREEMGRRRGERPSPDARPESAEFWAQFRDVHLAVSPETGRLLYLLARTVRARTVVEFGTSFGVSTLYLAAALRDNGGGHLIGTEFEAGKASAARRTLAAAGLDDLVEIRVGDALHTLGRDLPDLIDLVLLDGAKPLYPNVVTMLEPRLRADALVVADNAARSPEYLTHVRDGGGYFSLAGLAPDVEVSLRLGDHSAAGHPA